jgi:hypothetical protein
VFSGRGLCDGLITRPEESYRLWRVVVCDQEISKTRRLKPATGLWKIQPQWVVTPGKQTNSNSYSIRLCINGIDVVKFVEVTDILQNNSTVCNSSPVGYHSGLLSRNFLQLPPNSKLDILKDMKRLRHFKSVALGGVPNFIV